MSIFDAFYVRANQQATLKAIRQRFDKMEVEQNGDFIGVLLHSSLLKTKEPMLMQLSEIFDTDIFWLGFESAMDCFEFHHWLSGKHIRSLVYGLEEERTWERADGTPEIWESEFFFHPKNLEWILKYEEDEKQKDLLRIIYRDAKIEVGATEPSLGSKETASAIAQYYGFPHYGAE